MKESAKQHRVHKKGGKVLKKKRKQTGEATSGNNLKAFKFRSAIKARKLIRRAADLSEKKKHVPVIDRVPDVPPPLLVAIVGPPKVGKSTLLRCLVKNYVRQSITEIKGPVTVVTSKKRRVTFFEVPNDINAMVDAAKVADLVLLLVDASFGFEMEVFEFINICQVHGMPKMMGILTHMDKVPKSSKLKSLKKQMKHRFWTELYQGAKLFFLTGMQKQRYLPHEIKNLGRFISVARLRPILWRNSHPYVFCDRFEDLTDPGELKREPTVSRTIALYGYVRGVHMRDKSAIHIPGVGDLRVKSISILRDPCPLPTNQIAKRTLNEREQIIYAPFSGIGGIVYDRDAVYIDIGGSQSFSKKRNRDQLIEALEDIKEPVDLKMEKASLKLLSENPELEYEIEIGEGDYNNESDKDASTSINDEESGDEEKVGNRDGEDANKASAELQDLAKKLSGSFAIFPAHRHNWTKLVYESDSDGLRVTDDKEGTRQTKTFGGGLFRVSEDYLDAKDKTLLKNQEDALLYNFGVFQSSVHPKWDSEEFRESIKDSWVTGTWEPEDDDEADEQQDDEISCSENKADKRRKQSLWKKNAEREADLSDCIFDENGELNDQIDEKMAENSMDSELEEEEQQQKGEGEDEGKKGTGRGIDKKEKLRKQFDAEFDQTNEKYNALKEEFDKQSKLNKSVFENLDENERQELEGFRPGLYVRIEIDDVPFSFVECFDPSFPYIIGGLLPGEQNNGYIQVRVKKHRWYDRLLKSRDPLIISCGCKLYKMKGTKYIAATGDAEH